MCVRAKARNVVCAHVLSAPVSSTPRARVAKFLASFSDLEEWSDEQETLEESWHSRKFVEIRVDPTTHVAFLVLQGMGPEYDVMVGCVKLLPARPFARPLERDRDRETGSLRGRRGGRSSSPSTRR